MLNRVVVLTGCNRGLGLEFLRQLVNPPPGLEAKVKPSKIIATCRNTKDPGDELAELLERHRQSIFLYQLDLKDLPAIAAFAHDVSVSRNSFQCIAWK